MSLYLWQYTQDVLLSAYAQPLNYIYEKDFGSFLLSLHPILYHEDPMVFSVLASFILSLICWVLSLLTDRYSWVDKIWSILPPFYTCIFARQDLLLLLGGRFQECNIRLLTMCLISFIWGARLTYNFARKGGYKWDEQDYRWPVLRKVIPSIPWHIFNFVFTAVYQNYLLMILVACVYLCHLYRSTPFNEIDYLALALYLFFLLGEIIADQQQWRFQVQKHAMKAAERKGDYKRGFLTRGLFRYSRHPNFFCEQCLWWSFYVFSVGASGQWLNWTIIGPFLLTLIFLGSTPLTEYLSLQKYPEYAIYQQTTSRLLPWFPGDYSKFKDA